MSGAIAGAVIGALLVGGVAMAVYRDATSFFGFLIPVVGLAMAGAAMGAMAGTAAAADQVECPDGQVEVHAPRNSAGAQGCVPYELLPEIGEG